MNKMSERIIKTFLVFIFIIPIINFIKGNTFIHDKNDFNNILRKKYEIQGAK